MTPERTRLVLRLDAVVDLALGVVLVLAFWQELYDSLDLPRANPSFYPQLVGVVLVAAAYGVWAAAATPALARPVATAAAAGNLAAAVLIALWLIFKGKDDLVIGNGGVVLLAVVAVVLAAFAVAELAIARRPGAPSP